MILQETQGSPTRRPSAEPFLFEGGPVGLLMIHGLTGMPGEVRPMGERLAAAGYTVRGVLLPGHGGDLAELFGMSWHRWADAAEAELLALRARCERVVLVGFSLGGLLALYLAARHKQQVSGLVLLAPAMLLRNERQLALSGVAKHVLPWIYPLQRADFSDPQVRANILQHAPDADLDDPETVAQLRKLVRLPTGMIYELIRLKRMLLRNMWRVRQPLLVLQGLLDQTVDPAAAQIVLDRVGSDDKALRFFERSGHLIPHDVEREQVWAAAEEWLAARGFAR
jgi:carboxylesterase